MHVLQGFGSLNMPSWFKHINAFDIEQFFYSILKNQETVSYFVCLGQKWWVTLGMNTLALSVFEMVGILYGE